MPKFNQPIPARTPDAHTAQGGTGFSRSPKDALFVLGLANMVGESTFYETADARDARFEGLVHEVTKSDPAWARSFIAWMRSQGNMRSAPIVAAVEYIRAGGEGGRHVVASVLQRPDEPGEMLGYWLGKYGRAIPKPIKRGIADALPRLYNERNVLRYDGSGNTIRFGDVIEIVHPKPESDSQRALYKHLIDRRHGRPMDMESMPPLLAKDHFLLHVGEADRRKVLDQAVEAGWDWKRIGGWVPGGMDAVAWEAAIPNMGLMALTRNLRNFDQAGISDQVAHSVTGKFLSEEEVRKSRQFPLRFLTAWKAVSSLRWGSALEGALNLSTSNIPRLAGRTLVLVDVSPSMRDVAISTRTDGRVDRFISPQRWEAAGVFGAAVTKAADSADIVLFDKGIVATAKMHGSDSILRFVEQCGSYAQRSNGTDILTALAKSWDNHDRVVILTDEQHGYEGAWWSTAGHSRYGSVLIGYGRARWEDVAHVRCPVFTFNLGGFTIGVTPNERNWHTLGGLSDACFSLIPVLEQRHRDVWPWDIQPSPFSPQP